MSRSWSIPIFRCVNARMCNRAYSCLEIITLSQPVASLMSDCRNSVDDHRSPIFVTASKSLERAFDRTRTRAPNPVKNSNSIFGKGILRSR